VSGALPAGWYLRRLRAMSAAEVASRSGDAVRQITWSLARLRPGAATRMPRRAEGPLTFTAVLPTGARSEVPDAAARDLVAAADSVLAGTWTVFGVRRTDSADPDWFADPVTGRRAPRTRLAFRIDHRDETVTGNVKQVWEMSRHHHLTVLAAAAWLTGDDRYASAVDRQLRSWWRENPFLRGIHWTSGIEVGVRLLAWVWVRRLLDGWPGAGDLFERCDDAVRQIAWHLTFLDGFPSRGSSANNHAIAEAAGLLAGACAFDWYPECGRWRARSAALLERRLAANTFVSGLNRELATDYHRFVAELSLVAAVEAEAAGPRLSDGTWHRLSRMLDAGAAVLDSAGGPPRQGDGDSGRALVVDGPGRHPWQLALGTGAALVGPMPWWQAVDGGVQQVVLTSLRGAGGAREERATARDRPATRPRRFADAGLVLLRSRPQDGPEIWCRCDGGPHGFGTMAAHAHADALSVEVRHDGVELLVDPGTFCYHGDPAWRRYFRSTLAHNTVQVDGADQADPQGPFLWAAHPRTSTGRCEVGELAVQVWTAWHDGYRRLDVPVAHRRTVTLDSPGRLLVTRDDLVPSGPPREPGAPGIALAWHLGPDIEADLDGSRALLRWHAGGEARHGVLTLPGALTWTAHRGETSPVLGWYSPEFGRRVASTTLIGSGAGASASLVTTLDLSPAAPDGRSTGGPPGE
jgi:hypothetical protein